jgi:hypothetical protein
VKEGASTLLSAGYTADGERITKTEGGATRIQSFGLHDTRENTSHRFSFNVNLVPIPAFL